MGSHGRGIISLNHTSAPVLSGRERLASIVSFYISEKLVGDRDCPLQASRRGLPLSNGVSCEDQYKGCMGLILQHGPDNDRTR